MFIAAREDNSTLSTYDFPSYFGHLLSRLDLSRDLHFQTSTTIDTLDYSGTSLNHGSKLILAAAGEPRRLLGVGAAVDLNSFPKADGFSNLKVVMPGVLVLEATPTASMENLARALESWEQKEQYPWISIVDDASFTAKTIENWLWVTFTRSDPARDVYGVRHRTSHKHWICEAPLLVDARLKPYHQKPLTIDPEIEVRAKQKLQNALKRN